MRARFGKHGSLAVGNLWAGTILGASLLLAMGHALVACTSPQPGAERGTYRDEPGDAPGMDAGGTSCGGVVCDSNAACTGSGSEAECVCREGFEGNGTRCEDVDECEDDALHDCHPEARCIDRPGSYRCECPEGLVGDGRECRDIDECAGEANLCDPNAVCDNTSADFSCTCLEGFRGDGYSCGDVNECEDEDGFACASHASCVNLFGSYECRCDPGHSADAEGVCRPWCEAALADPERCADEGSCRVQGRSAGCDACAPGYAGDGTDCEPAACDPACDGEGGDDAPHAVCTAEGSCACAPGYTGTPGSCQDVDECAEDEDRCGDHARCIDVPGGFLCDCEAGYALGDDDTCVDIDECAADVGPCHPDATCTNLTPEEDPRGYACECEPGFSGDGSECRDIDECAEDDGGCPANASCINRRGSFSCECAPPLVGDADSCHCDLSGVWAMRQDLDGCWPAVPIMEGTGENLISAGSVEATVWELHELRYDGERLVVRKKGCGSDNEPDLVSPLFRETYSDHVPHATFDALSLESAPEVDAGGLVPGSRFTTPEEALVVGIDLGEDPLNATWPSGRDQVSADQWVDADGDGEPGITLWPRLPSQITEAGTRHYSYLPARPVVGGETLAIEERVACMSVATRLISHLEAEVESCDRLVGEVITERTQGRVHSCTLVDKGTCDPDDPTECSGWQEDISCGADQWSERERCSSEDLDRLDEDENQRLDSRATFELVRIGSLDDDLNCPDVREALPAIVRPAPTITCTTPP